MGTQTKQKKFYSNPKQVIKFKQGLVFLLFFLMAMATVFNMSSGGPNCHFSFEMGPIKLGVTSFLTQGFIGYYFSIMLYSLILSSF